MELVFFTYFSSDFGRHINRHINMHGSSNFSWYEIKKGNQYYSWTRFFCQGQLWIFCFSPEEALCYWLLPTPGCSQKSVIRILYVLLWTPLPFLPPFPCGAWGRASLGTRSSLQPNGAAAVAPVRCLVHQGHTQVFHSHLMAFLLWGWT